MIRAPGGNLVELGWYMWVGNDEELDRERERDVFLDGSENEDAEDDVLMHSMPPTASRHQPGIAGDIPANSGSPTSGTMLVSRIGSVSGEA
jgi:hypothetical protein